LPVFFRIAPLAKFSGRRIPAKGVFFLILVFFLASGFLFSGKAKQRSFTLPGGFNEAWEAALETLHAEEIPVLKEDKANGYIQTGTFPLYKKEYKAWTNSPPLSSPGFCVLEIGVVEIAPAVSAVGIKAHFKRKQGFYLLGYRKKDKSRGGFEKLLAGRINDRLVKKKYPKLENIVVGCNFRYSEELAKYTIAEADKQSLGYEQGLRNKDVLLAIEGMEIHPGNLFRFFLDVEGEVVRKFKLKRGREELEIPVSVFYLDPQAPRFGFTAARDEESGKFKVEKVAENSPAQAAGFQTGDFLLKENSFFLNGWKPYYQALLAEKAGAEQTFLIERNGITSSIKVIPASTAATS